MRRLACLLLLSTLTACGSTVSSSGDSSTPDSQNADALAIDANTNSDAAIPQDSALDTATMPADATMDAVMVDASGCSQPSPGCVAGTAGGACGDGVSQSICASGQWTCPPGQVFPSECACIGRPASPNCVCTRMGWSCNNDAGNDASEAGPQEGGTAICIGRPASCVSGERGGLCGDALVPPMCVSGSWQCPRGTIPITECACVGLPAPGCTCTPSGWSCGGDAAADAPTDATASCLGRPASCVSGTPGGSCGDVTVAPNCVAGSWQCPSGTIPITQCACVGRPPGSNCTCTPMGWNCADAGTDAGRTFTCGTLQCRSNVEYCYSFTGGVPGSGTRYQCNPLPDTCFPTPSCRCITSPGGICSQNSTGDITVRVLAP